MAVALINTQYIGIKENCVQLHIHIYNRCIKYQPSLNLNVDFSYVVVDQTSTSDPRIYCMLGKASVCINHRKTDKVDGSLITDNGDIYGLTINTLVNYTHSHCLHTQRSITYYYPNRYHALISQQAWCLTKGLEIMYFSSIPCESRHKANAISPCHPQMDNRVCLIVMLHHTK